MIECRIPKIIRLFEIWIAYLFPRCKALLRKRYCKQYLFFSTLLFSTYTLTASDRIEKEPQAVVYQLQEALIDVMKKPHLTYDERFQILTPVIQSTHELQSISRIIIGRYWKKLTSHQKKDFVQLFSEQSIAVYARQFREHSGEQFRIVSTEQKKKGRMIVHTLLVQENGEGIELDYILSKINRQWKIVNILMEGISDLALKRSEYKNILRQGGFDFLMEKLEEKIHNLSQ